MHSYYRAPLPYTIILAVLLVLPACAAQTGTPTATASVGQRQANAATPTHPAPPGTPATPQHPATPATPATPRPTQTATPLTGAAAILSRLPEATALTIQDDLWVYGPVAPIERHFSLYRRADSFAGSGRIVESRRGTAPNYKQEQRIWAGELAVPLAAIQSLLNALAIVPLREGAYKPAITHSDDSPALDILIATPAGTVWFFTTSNEVEHVPWGAVIGERTYVIDSPLPTRALGALGSYLGPAALNYQGSSIDDPLACRADVPSIKAVASVPAPPSIITARRPSPSDPPRPRIGETINIAERHGLHDAPQIAISGPGRNLVVSDRAVHDQFIAMLDQPLVTIPTSGMGPSRFERLYFDMYVPGKGALTLNYHLGNGEISNWTTYYAGEEETIYAVRAPTGFAALLLAQFCGR
ncbi:MAG: hypothetical protein U0841_22765 [Chloroflexia bacterium]